MHPIFYYTSFWYNPLRDRFAKENFAQ